MFGGSALLPLNAALCLITQNQLFTLFFVHLAFKFFPCRQANFSGRCLLDFNSWVLKVQRVASLKCSV